MNVRERSAAIVAHIDGLTLRERLFVFAAVLMIVGALWESTLYGPLAARTEATREAVSATAGRLAQLEEAIAISVAGFEGGSGNRQQVLTSLREAVSERERELLIFTSDLVDPAQMRLVVEDLMKRQQGLRLMRTANVEARPLLQGEPDADSNAGPNLYQHGIVIELEGSYLELLAYLESIERLPWRIYWSRLELETLEHPILGITLELNTLSLESEWIGV